MRNVVVLNPKGGSGKTTIATHLAVYASTLGLRVALVDHDAQQSSLDWIKSRPRRCADIEAVAAFEGEEIPSDLDVAVHDMPGSQLAEYEHIIYSCDKLLIPIMPSPIDIKAATRLWTSLSEKGWLDKGSMDIGIVANRVKSNAKYLATFNQFIESIGIPRVATLRDTQNYIRALDGGLSLFDLPPSRVTPDLVQWQSLMEWTGFYDIEDEELFEMLGLEQLKEDGFDMMMSSSGGGNISGSSDMPDMVSLDDLDSLEGMGDMESTNNMGGDILFEDEM